MVLHINWSVELSQLKIMNWNGKKNYRPSINKVNNTEHVN